MATIDSGAMPPGTNLESTRVLAQRLNISRDTAVRAYRYLADHGYIESDGARGTFVKARASGSGSETSVATGRAITFSSFGQNLVSDTNFDSPTLDFSVLNNGAVPKEALPLKRWRENMQAQCQSLTARHLNYEVDVAGRIALRKALSRFLQLRGITTTASEIVVFNISLTAVSLIFKILLEEGDTIAVEDPGYAPIKQLAKTQKLRIASIPLDNQGISIDLLEACSPAPRLIYVTPTHQDPTTITMSLSRRQALLRWAEAHDSYIVEDDFDSYFYHSGHRQIPLKALDTSDRVIYVSTFWQILYPLTTVSYIIAPPSLIPSILRAKALSEGVSEAMPQMALAELLDNGFMQTHLRKWNNIFSSRRRAAIFHLKSKFGANIEIENHSGGLNLLFRLPDREPQLVLKAIRESRLPAVDISYLYENSAKHQYLLNFASLNEAGTAEIIEAFHKCLSRS